MNAMLKKKARFFDRNARHLDYCRSRLNVSGVSVDDLDRDAPFSVTQRSQLLELGEILANFHLSNMIGAKLNTKSEETMKMMAMMSSSSSKINIQNTNSSGISMVSSIGGGGGGIMNQNSSSQTQTQTQNNNNKMMTNAFTPRPEASLQLNNKDTLRQAGLDTSSYSSRRPPIRCPFCATQPHTLHLDVSAMRMGGFAEKQAFRCRCCGQSRAGIVPTMVCNRCKLALCADCIKVSEAPLVESVLSAAAMAAAARSFGELVSQLWGGEIAGALFGPIHPAKSLPPKKATLEDLGVALGTGRNLFTTEQSQQQLVELQHMMGFTAPTTTTVVERGLVVPASMTKEQLLIQQRRPLSSVGVVSLASSRQTLYSTPCSKTMTPTTDVHVVVVNNNNSRPPSAFSTTSTTTGRSLGHVLYKHYSEGQEEDIFKDQKKRPSSSGSAASGGMSTSRHRQKRLPPLPFSSSSSKRNRKSENDGELSFSIPALRKDDDTGPDDNEFVFQHHQQEEELRQKKILEQEEKMKKMMEKVGYNFHQGGYSRDFYNVGHINPFFASSSSSPSPSPSSVLSFVSSPQPQQQQQQQQREVESNNVFNLTETSVVTNNKKSELSSVSITQQEEPNQKTATTKKSAPSKCAHCTWISSPGLQGRVMRAGSRIDGEVFAASDPVEQHASSIGYGWRNRHVLRMTRIPEMSRGNLGRLRSHIERSLAQARRTVERADAEAERERLASALHGRRMREASSRDMVRQFRQEAEALSNRLVSGDGASGGVGAVVGGTTDEGHHKRQIAAEIEKYANKFCAGATTLRC
jgi:hypothetical protein